jgi:hypothetical protein
VLGLRENSWNSLRELSLPKRLLLALVSAFSTWPSSLLADLIKRALPDLPIKPFVVLSGVVFGVLVMTPFIVAPRHRILRAAIMCVASVLIYHFAIEFVMNGPLRSDTPVPWLLVGGTSALLIGLAVVLLAPLAFHWSLLGLTLAAGGIGGVALDRLGAAFAEGPFGFIPFAAWQLPVCLALHFGLRRATD